MAGGDYAGTGLANPVAFAADDLADHAGGVCGSGRRRHCAGAAVQPIQVAGTCAAALCDRPAGDAGHRDCAAAADLPAAADRGDRLRLDRRLLSGVVEHHPGAQFGGSQPLRAFPAPWRVAGADVAISEVAGSIALYPRRAAYLRWIVADRRRGRGNRSRFGRRGLRTCVQDCGIRLPAQHSPHVAALLLLSMAGIVIYMCLAATSHLLLRRWHESALRKEN